VTWVCYAWKMFKASATLPSFKTTKTKDSAALPALRQPLQQIYSRRWTSETKRYLHVHRERRWLALKHKHQFLDFSPQERVELRRYFDELAGVNGRICLEELETMLISLGLAENPRDVRVWADQVDDLKVGELDFEQFLELVLRRNDSNLVTVFMHMASGKLGNANLNFQTLISAYRRQLFLDASGAGTSVTSGRQLGGKVLQSFADLQRNRWGAKVAADKEAQAMGLETTAPGQLESDDPDFNVNGHAPVGGLEMIWRGVCAENDLWPARPVSEDGRKARILNKPPSPREILRTIRRDSSRKKVRASHTGTIFVEAPSASEEKQDR